MTNLLSIIVLIFEVLYYSLFMKFARKEGNFWRYILLFTIITIFFAFIGTDQIYSYLLLVITILYGLKYIVGLKVSLYDMLFILLMLFVKIIIETPLYIILFKFISNYIIGLIVSIIKIFVLFLLKDKLDKVYNLLKIKWDNNDFYVRYIFSICCFIYCIITAILLIKYSIG